MALKRKLANLDGLAADVAALYTKQNDGTYLLDAEPDDDITALRNTVTATRRERDEALAKAKEFDGLDVEEAKRILNRASTDEEQKMLKEGKTLDDVFKKRTEALQAAHTKAVAALTAQAEKMKGVAGKYTQKVLDNELRVAVGVAKGFPEAMDDFLLRGRQTFQLDEDGNVVAKDAEGQPIYGKDGKTLLQPAEYYSNLREVAPHLFPAPSGSGTPSQQRGNGSPPGKTMKLADFQARSPKEHSQIMSEGKTTVVD